MFKCPHFTRIAAHDPVVLRWSEVFVMAPPPGAMLLMMGRG
jgi:hypothetical protein